MLLHYCILLGVAVGLFVAVTRLMPAPKLFLTNLTRVVLEATLSVVAVLSAIEILRNL